MQVVNPSFEYESKLWSSGTQFVAGADEVGRGCFAGPVVTAVVSFEPKVVDIFSKTKRVVVRDSKKMTERQRKIADNWIRENAVYSKVGEASVGEINENGISAATFSAFRRALKGTKKDANNRPQFILVDAIYIPNIGYKRINDQGGRSLYDLNDGTYKQLAITKGDQISFSIAAASIVAKVYRDKLMERLGDLTKFSHYKWQQNKGYGTKAHRNAIIKHGVTIHHRKQFVDTFLKNNNSVV